MSIDTYEYFYPQPPGSDFSKALINLKQGAKFQRKGWNGKGMWIEIQIPDENSTMTLPYIFMFTADGQTVPWLASQTDILANDWGFFHPQIVYPDPDVASNYVQAMTPIPTNNPEDTF